MSIFLCFFLFFITSVAAACDRCVHQSKAAHFQDDSPLSSGACGYGTSALGLNGGYLAASAPSLYKSGAGCGACFQIRCTNPKLCNKTGTNVTVSDINTSDQTTLVLSNRAFIAMANKGFGQKILDRGIVAVEHKRIPCEYKNQNIVASVDEASQKPYYLAVKFLYQGGQTDILAVDVAQVGSSDWGYMRRRNGAVWDTSKIPNGPLQFRLVVRSSPDGKYIYTKSVLPADWRSGIDYDAGVQISDIAQEACSPCDNGTW